MSQVSWQACTAASSGWREQAVKHAYSVTLGKMLQNAPAAGDDIEVFYLKAQHVQWDGVNLTDLPTMWASPEEVDLLRVKVGDLLVCEGGEVGRAAIVDREPEAPTIIQNALHLVRGRNGSNTRFLLYVLRQAVESNWIAAVCNASTISHFTAEKFREMRVWLPHSRRQAAIADRLDRETARLGTLVAATQRLLELLVEKNRTVVTRTVSRGPNPLVQTRDSGVPWLGDIPRHWEIWKIGHLAVVGNGSTPSRSNGSYWADRGVAWLNSGAVNHAEITAANQFVTQFAIRRCHLPIVKRGAVLIAITGQGKTRGRASVLSIDSTISQHLAFIQLRGDRLLPWFLRWVLFAAHDFLRGISDDSGGTRGALTCEQVADLRVPVPPLNEQRAIVDYVSRNSRFTNSLRFDLEKCITLAEERRAALVSGTVGGPGSLGGNVVGTST